VLWVTASVAPTQKKHGRNKTARRDKMHKTRNPTARHLSFLEVLGVVGEACCEPVRYKCETH
jgi:hypothetical protein